MNIGFKNIFIIDWDDTLFPSNWIVSNKIDLTNEYIITKYKLYFLELDKIINDFLVKLQYHGIVYIVTNATIRWIASCLHLLPKTKHSVIEKKVTIISARDTYSNKSESPYDWKTFTFQDVIYTFIKNTGSFDKDMRINIFSLGDANYEYVALINVDKYLKKENRNNFRYYLKNIRFIEKPDFNVVVNQIKKVDNNIFDLIQIRNYIDILLLA